MQTDEEPVVAGLHDLRLGAKAYRGVGKDDLSTGLVRAGLLAGRAVDRDHLYSVGGLRGDKAEVNICMAVAVGVAVADASQFKPPRSGTIVRPFEKQQWPALQMMLADPDGRQLAVEAPLPSTRKRSIKNRATKKR